MEENNTNDINPVKPDTDFEMGPQGPQDHSSKINSPEKVNPTAEFKPPVSANINTGHSPSLSTPVAKNPPNPDARKKAILGCLGAIGGISIIFIILALIFISQGEKITPLAKAIGLNQAVFVNGLITLVNIFFILLALTTFVVTMVGLFKASMAKKEDKLTKKSGLNMAIFGGTSFMIILMIWGFLYFYLDSKRIIIDKPLAQGIVTEPEETLNLTAPVEIRFDGSRLPIDSKKYQIITYQWDFGDGSKGTKQIEKHTYKSKGKNGRYDVELSVTLRDKNTKEEKMEKFTKTITISDDSIIAFFEVSPKEGEAPLTVKFDAADSSDPDGEIASYEWDFDEDGEFDDGDGVEVEYQYKKIGIFNPALRVTSDSGDFAIYEGEIKVIEKTLPKAVISVADNPQNYVKGVQYIFSAQDSTSPNGKIVQYEWDFGDGKIKKTKTVQYSFEKNGTYEVKLSVEDEKGKIGEVTKKVIIGNEKGTPEPVITTEPALKSGELKLKGTAPFVVSFDGSKTSDSDNNIVEYEWDLDGDGKTDQFNKTFSHTFTQEGTYTIILQVTDADKNQNTASIIIEVVNQGITANLQADKVEGDIPVIINFDASGSSYDQGQIVSYRWDFGDGTPAKLGNAQISHKYNQIGTFKVTLTVIGSDNSTNSVIMYVTAREVALNACWMGDKNSGTAPLSVTFDPACSTGTIKNYFWDFGDGSSSINVKPTHDFTKPGVYKIKLEITDFENTVSENSKTITVTAKK